MTTPFDDLHCQYASASGTSHQECAFIGRRWRDAYGTTMDASDFYVLGNRASKLQFWGPWPNMMTALWQALPSRRVYACDASQGSVHVWEDIMDINRPARIDPIGLSAEGIWGLDEDHIYAWGVRSFGPGKQEPSLVSFDGKVWREMPHPGFYVVRIHGIAPDLLCAAGRSGGMARWNGREWTTFSMPSEEHFTDVFVAGPDEMYATGMNGSLLQGTTKGWSEIARTIDDRLPLACVAKFADQLFVGGLFQGLFRRVGATDQLERHKKLDTSKFEVRGDVLLVTCRNLVAGTTDGETFGGAAIDDLARLTATVDIAER